MYAKMLMAADGSKVAEQMFLYARVLAGTPMIPPAQSSQPSAAANL